jgi:hypothetical protein
VVIFQSSNVKVPCSAATGGGLGGLGLGLGGICYMRQKRDSSDADRRQQGNQSLLVRCHEAKKKRAGRHAHSV